MSTIRPAAGVEPWLHRLCGAIEFDEAAYGPMQHLTRGDGGAGVLVAALPKASVQLVGYPAYAEPGALYRHGHRRILR